MAEEWITTAEAAELLNISERQVRNKAANGKLKAKREGNKWLIHSSLSEAESELEGNRAESKISERISDNSEIVIRKLEADNEWLRKRIEELERQLTQTHQASEEASERHDTIVMQLTRQLEQSQRMLAAHQEPWYRRWFRKKADQ